MLGCTGSLAFDDTPQGTGRKVGIFAKLKHCFGTLLTYGKNATLEAQGTVGSLPYVSTQNLVKNINNNLPITAGGLSVSVNPSGPVSVSAINEFIVTGTGTDAVSTTVISSVGTPARARQILAGMTMQNYRGIQAGAAIFETPSIDSVLSTSVSVSGAGNGTAFDLAIPVGSVPSTNAANTALVGASSSSASPVATIKIQQRAEFHCASPTVPTANVERGASSPATPAIATRSDENGASLSASPAPVLPRTGLGASPPSASPPAAINNMEAPGSSQLTSALNMARPLSLSQRLAHHEKCFSAGCYQIRTAPALRPSFRLSTAAQTSSSNHSSGASALEEYVNKMTTAVTIQASELPASLHTFKRGLAPIWLSLVRITEEALETPFSTRAFRLSGQAADSVASSGSGSQSPTAALGLDQRVGTYLTPPRARDNGSGRCYTLRPDSRPAISSIRYRSAPRAGILPSTPATGSTSEPGSADLSLTATTSPSTSTSTSTWVTSPSTNNSSPATSVKYNDYDTVDPMDPLYFDKSIRRNIYNALEILDKKLLDRETVADFGDLQIATFKGVYGIRHKHLEMLISIKVNIPCQDNIALKVPRFGTTLTDLKLSIRAKCQLERIPLKSTDFAIEVRTKDGTVRFKKDMDWAQFLKNAGSDRGAIYLKEA